MNHQLRKLLPLSTLLITAAAGSLLADNCDVYQASGQTMNSGIVTYGNCSTSLCMFSQCGPSYSWAQGCGNTSDWVCQN